MSDEPPIVVTSPHPPAMPWQRPLTQDEMQVGSDFINSHVATGPNDLCPSCGDGVSEFLSSLATIPMAPTIQHPNGRNILPTAITVCRKCGYVRLFSAKIIGLLDLEKGTDA